MPTQSATSTLAQTIVVNGGRDMAIVVNTSTVLVTSHSQYGSWHRVNPVTVICDAACRGFTERGHCRHIAGAREAVGLTVPEPDPTHCRRCHMQMTSYRVAAGKVVCCTCELAIDREQAEIRAAQAAMPLARGFVR